MFRGVVDVYIKYHGFGWSLSLLTCVIAHADRVMTFTSDGTCWLDSHYIFALYAPLYFYTLFAIGVIVYAAVNLGVEGQQRHSKSRRSREAGIRMVQQMVVFTMGFLAIWFWGIVHRLQEYSSGLPADKYSGSLTFTPARW